MAKKFFSNPDNAAGYANKTGGELILSRDRYVVITQDQPKQETTERPSTAPSGDEYSDYAWTESDY